MNSELNCDRYFLPLVVNLKLDFSIYLWTWNRDLGLGLVNYIVIVI